MTDDFKSSKADHARAGRELVEQHKSVTEYYVNLIKSTKEKAVRVIDAHKLEIYKAKTDYSDLKTKTEIEIAELKVRLSLSLSLSHSLCLSNPPAPLSRRTPSGGNSPETK